MKKLTHLASDGSDGLWICRWCNEDFTDYPSYQYHMENLKETCRQDANEPKKLRQV